jgi:pilus assembly protein CpaE
MSGFVLLTPDAEFVQRVTELLQRPNDVRQVWDPSWAAADQAADAILARDPDVVVVGPDAGHDDDQLDLVALLEQRRPQATVIVVGDTTGRFALAAMRAGARDLLEPDASDAAVLEVLQRAKSVVERRRSTLAAPEEIRRRVITVLSPKGGTGKTTLSTNLAVGLARAQVGPVVIVDLDIQFGDVSGALGLEPEHTLADAARTFGLTSTTLKMLLTPHHTGVHVLAPPTELSEADEITGDHLKRIFGLLVEEFPWIVVDTSAGIDEAAIVAMEFATDLLFVGSTDVPAVRAVRRQIQALDQIGITQPTRHLVLNRASARVGLEAEDIANTVGLPVSHQIPSSRQVPISTNQGVPILESSSKDPLNRAYAAVVESFLPDRAQQTEKRRWRPQW